MDEASSDHNDPIQASNDSQPKADSGVKWLDQQIGKKVTIEGIAQDAKEGATVEGIDFVIFIDQLDSWPRSVLGRKVTATGTLLKAKLTPEPVVDQFGGYSAGSFGDSYILKDARWEIKH
jgi:hypothetical protein